MLKPYYIIIYIFMLNASCGSDSSTKLIVDKDNPIKKIHEWKTSFKDGKEMKSESIKEFDKAGNDTYGEVKKEGETSFKIIKKYNDKGQNILNEGIGTKNPMKKKMEYNEHGEESYVEYYKDGKLSSTNKMVEEAGKITEVHTNSKGEEKIMSVKEIDSQRRIVKQLENLENDTLVTTFEYDARNNVIKEVKNRMRFKKFSRIYTNEYNVKDQLLEHKILDMDGGILKKVTNKYGSEGNISEQLESDDTEVQTLTNYNEKGLMIKKSKTRNNNWIPILERQYNDQGHVIEEQNYDFKGDLKKTTVSTYKYDSRDNWIEKKVVVDGAVKEQSKREIEYY